MGTQRRADIGAVAYFLARLVIVVALACGVGRGVSC